MIESVKEYFHTDWAAMTDTDWFGLVAVITLSILMLALYIYVFNPKNKDKLESHRGFVLKDNSTDEEDDNHGRKK